MLVLSRKTRQQIRIGDNITVTILLVKGQVVRVGVDAPRDVRVLRAELPVFDEPPAPRAPVQNTSKSAARPRALRRADAASTTHKSREEGAARTSPGLLELRRRKSLTALTRGGSRPTPADLRPLFEKH